MSDGRFDRTVYRPQAASGAVNFERSKLQAAVRHACELDVKALKPGNVSIDSPGYGMTGADFVASAAAIAEPITAPGLAVGERIFRAIEATQRAVNCNTNLGIVMLLAPIIQALEYAANGSLERNLIDVLTNLSLADAAWTYRAIQLAKPGGMGTSARHDIAEPPTVTLLQAMQEAAERDQIARLYTTGYARLLQYGVPVWREFLQRWDSEEWATTAIFLTYLAEENDSLIARKFGTETSRRVSDVAKIYSREMNQVSDPNQVRAALSEWDTALKREGLNPGTTADLTVATVFLAALQDT
jgi:triphosphoribosyl-dephospho-CoA synthase